MKLYGGWWCRAALVVLCCCLLVLTARQAEGHPIGNPDHALENMRQIPQWHCLRYRRFDLVKRCRNYRVAQTTTHHESSESHHLHRVPHVAVGTPDKTLADK